MCLRLHPRMRKFAVVLEKLPPGADVLLIARRHPASSPGVVTNVSDFGFRVVGAVGISTNLVNVPASIGSSYAGLCKRRRPGRFGCGDHGVKSIAFIAAGTHLGDCVLLCFS